MCHDYLCLLYIYRRSILIFFWFHDLQTGTWLAASTFLRMVRASKPVIHSVFTTRILLQLYPLSPLSQTIWDLLVVSGRCLAGWYLAVVRKAPLATRAFVYTRPLLDSFPGVTRGGRFCDWLIGRGVVTPYVKECEVEKAVRCCVHITSAVYLIMSYSS